ncbi:MAG TPA: hypothetical protein O0X97_05830 [Methanocorpusculum sp.]|nr:hypothetical protein [Methanocorpusculum sp.]
MTPSYPELGYEEGIRKLLAQHKSVRKIASALGCSEKAVWCAMKKYGIKQQKLLPSEEVKEKLSIK